MRKPWCGAPYARAGAAERDRSPGVTQGPRGAASVQPSTGLEMQEHLPVLWPGQGGQHWAGRGVPRALGWQGSSCPAVRGTQGFGKESRGVWAAGRGMFSSSSTLPL